MNTMEDFEQPYTEESKISIASRELELWLFEDMKNFTDRQYGKERIKKLLEFLKR